MKNKKVINLREYVASCPECGCQKWLIKLDGLNFDWKNILGTECNDCGFLVPIEIRKNL